MQKRQPSIGDVVMCWGVGFNMSGESAIIVEIDYSKKYPYRIQSQRPMKGNGIWCGRHEFKFADPPTLSHYVDTEQLATWRKENN